MLNIGDKVTVIVDDTCSFPKGHKGVITGIREDLDNNMLYEVDEGYEYSSEELELTPISFDHSKMNLKITVPNEIPKSNLEPTDYSKIIFEKNIEILRLNKELLGLYRELHRINKDSKA